MAEIGYLDLEKINRFFFPVDLASFVADLIIIITAARDHLTVLLKKKKKTKGSN